MMCLLLVYIIKMPFFPDNTVAFAFFQSYIAYSHLKTPAVNHNLKEV